MLKATRTLVVGVVAGGVVAALGIGAYTFGWIPGTAPAAVRSATLGVRAAMADPWSVRFDIQSSTPRLVCGEFNAKNSYGAYVGFKRFMSGPDGFRLDPGVPDLEAMRAERLAIVDPDVGTEEYNRLKERLSDACFFSTTYLADCRPEARRDLRAIRAGCESLEKQNWDAFERRMVLFRQRHPRAFRH